MIIWMSDFIIDCMIYHTAYMYIDAGLYQCIMQTRESINFQAHSHILQLEWSKLKDL